MHTLQDSRCKYCGKTYINQSLLKKHQRVYHPDALKLKKVADGLYQANSLLIQEEMFLTISMLLPRLCLMDTRLITGDIADNIQRLKEKQPNPNPCITQTDCHSVAMDTAGDPIGPLLT